jgi:hypothetical protein
VRPRRSENIPPTQQGLTGSINCIFNERLDLLRFAGLGRQEHHPHSIFARSGQAHIIFLEFLFEKRVGNLQQDAGAISSVSLGTLGTAVPQIHQDFKSLSNDAVRRLPFDIDDKTHTTAVVFESRVVESALC